MRILIKLEDLLTISKYIQFQNSIFKKINISKCFVPSASSLHLREIGQILNYNNIEVVELNKNKIENYNLPIEIKGQYPKDQLCSKFY